MKYLNNKAKSTLISVLNLSTADRIVTNGLM
jgi:hypothetical protein